MRKVACPIACRRIPRYLAESTARGLQSELLQDQYEFQAGWRMKRCCATLNEQTGSSLPRARWRHGAASLPRAEKDSAHYLVLAGLQGWTHSHAVLTSFLPRTKWLVWQVETQASVLSIQWFLAGPRTPPQLPSHHAWKEDRISRLRIRTAHTRRKSDAPLWPCADM